MLSLQDATTFVGNPRTIEVEFPYGEVMESEPPSSEDETPHHSNKRAADSPEQDESKGTKNFGKYSKNILSDLVIPVLKQTQDLNLPNSMKKSSWGDIFIQLTSLAVSSSSWKCRLASFHKLEKFAKETGTNITWPLDDKLINGFIVWAFKNKQISSKTTKTYLCHLNSIQKLLGFEKFDINKHNSKTLLKGFQNGENLSKNSHKTRDTIEFSTLKKIKKKIRKEKSNKIRKKCIWAACVTAFFGCFRMGELLPKFEKKSDKKFDLLWKDIKLNKKHAEIVLKTQKNKILEKQTIHIFKFKDKKVCPIRALFKLKQQAINNGIFSNNKPVFALQKEKFLTQRKMNMFLKTSFPKNKFSGHSFRAGVPSSLADFPNIANDWHVMGWGRWRSPSFLKYQKRTKKQSKWIFKKIEKALL
jgi:integrase